MFMFLGGKVMVVVVGRVYSVVVVVDSKVVEGGVVLEGEVIGREVVVGKEVVDGW